MRLTYLPVNQAYVFTFGDQLVRMGDGPMFHETHADAVAAANACTLAVLRSGLVVADRDGYGHETTPADVVLAEVSDCPTCTRMLERPAVGTTKGARAWSMRAWDAIDAHADYARELRDLLAQGYEGCESG